MRRREFILALGGAVACSLRVRAQQRRKPLIGLLAAASPQSAAPQDQAMADGLRDLGYVEGRDYEMIIRSAFGDMSRLPQLAQELVNAKPDLIIGAPTPSIVALQLHAR